LDILFLVFFLKFFQITWDNKIWCYIYREDISTRSNDDRA